MIAAYRCIVLCKSRLFKTENVFAIAGRFLTAVTNRDIPPLVNMHHAKGYESVTDFYAGKSVLLTGATGFVGRILMEKLLSNCKDIEKVYVLIRQKKESGIEERVQEMLKNPVFTKLKETKAQAIEKIVPIAGDLSEPGLGMSSEDEQMLIDEVSVVFHSAADVRFALPIADHLRVNYEGTKKVLELGKKMKNLDIFVYVSTAYSNDVSVIEESAYPAPRKIEDVYHILEKYGNDSKQARELLDKNGNSYAFSKKMAEGYVANNHGDLPTIIVRPSMITSVYKEPLVGYSDSWVAGTGVFCDVATGLTRVLYGSQHCVVDMIPVDYVCNFLIVAAARNSRTKELNVYNICTSHANPINWEKSMKIFLKESKKHDYAEMPFPMVYFTERKWAMPLLVLVLQIIPSYIADMWLRLRGEKPRYMKLQKRVIPRTPFFKPVTAVSWLFKTARTQKLISTLDDRDRTTFPCDPATINWEKYIPIYCKGVKEHMLRDKNKK